MTSVDYRDPYKEWGRVLALSNEGPADIVCIAPTLNIRELVCPVQNYRMSYRVDVCNIGVIPHVCLVDSPYVPDTGAYKPRPLQ